MTDSCRRGVGRVEQRKKGKRISQKIHMKDLWTWAIERGLTVGERGSLSGGGKGKKVRTTIIE